MPQALRAGPRRPHDGDLGIGGSFARQPEGTGAPSALREHQSAAAGQVEHGLIELVSTLQIDGTRITLGAPVPEAERTPGWALMHLVTVNPEYAGPRARHDFESRTKRRFRSRLPQRVRKERRANQSAGGCVSEGGNFANQRPISGRALSLTRDFKPVQLGSDDVRIAQADLLLRQRPCGRSGRGVQSAARGRRRRKVSALMALDDNKDNEARSRASGCHRRRQQERAGLAGIGPLGTPMRTDLKKASELNPRWAEPYLQLADVNPAIDKENLEERAALLKKAAALDPRNIDYWQALAKTDIAAKDFARGAESLGGRRARRRQRRRTRAHSPGASAGCRRSASISKRPSASASPTNASRPPARESAERSRHSRRRRRSPQETESRTARRRPRPRAGMKQQNAGPVWKACSQRLDCLGKQARLVIQTADGKTVQLLVADPSQIAIGGGGEQSLSCGPQKNAAPGGGAVQCQAGCQTAHRRRCHVDRIPLSSSEVGA